MFVENLEGVRRAILDRQDLQHPQHPQRAPRLLDGESTMPALQRSLQMPSHEANAKPRGETQKRRPWVSVEASPVAVRRSKAVSFAVDSQREDDERSLTEAGLILADMASRTKRAPKLD